MMEKIWKVEMNLLKIFDELCRKHNIKYFVTYGTLLGAARHKGFIPWDDDIDIFMMRDEYERLQKIAPGEIKEPYFYQNVYTDQMVWGISKLRDSRTTAIEFPNMSEEFNQGIFIDIFPLDAANDGSSKMKMVTAIKNDIWKCIFGRETIAANIDNPDIFKEFTIDKDTVLELASLSYREAFRCFEDLCSEHFNDSEYVESWSSAIMGVNRPYPKSWFDEIEYLPFGDMMVPAPKNYEEVLEKIYGDWRTPVKGAGCLHTDIIIDTEISYLDWFKQNRKIE